mmetsp:Transcript_31975/g.75207  ORF Transcript_31975/g.75207 Transcript_31975/m.75207 type:complete len:140 (+) Transcript_31975:2375-2794(+)
MVKTIPIIKEAEGVVEDILRAEVANTVTFTRTAEVVVEEEEEATDLMEITRITKVWTMTAVAAAKEVETVMMKVAETVNSNGIEVQEEIIGMTEEDEDPMEKVVLVTAEVAVAGGHGVGNNEEIIVEDVATTAVVVATS